ncbi:hypothetical protein BC939DRAFT_464071 [Gamsiella multidivaricata]|uniref:uncharacterized protein n=1 Tax=Gamsiella multidivaricata TaxID=101098 RepID=UPI002220606D|nr:uncharacterized protein BC939DRAFT_464071 [Gamsiella multidivaricata]KAI7818015.1 hypothetical protein BC939DRAFT_464071 [Gamsiella multidivaricata]
MTERIKLQSKQLDIQLAAERLRGSPPARTYPSHSTEAPSGPYASSSLYYGSSSSNSYSHYSSADASRSHPSSSKHSHLDHIAHTPQEPQDPSQSTHQGPLYSHHDKHAMQPSPQSRPPFLKINTAVRQYHPQPPSTQRMPPSPHSTLPPLPSTNPPKTSNRHYGLPPLSSSAQSSPAAVVDYQSHIPPPLTPKDDHVSPTSALSPTHMKRKSLNHDAVMDAVRAKVFRNAAGQQHQQQTKKTAIESEHDLSSRRKIYQEKPSPEVQKKQPELVSSESRQDEYPEVKLEVKEGPLLSSLPVSISSPASPSSKNTENGETSSRSRSSSPPPSSSTSSKSRRPMGISQQLELASVSEAMEDVNVSNSETDGRRPDRTAENGVSAH